MIKKMKTATKVFSGFGVVLLLSFIIGGIGWYAMSGLSHDVKLLDKANFCVDELLQAKLQEKKMSLNMLAKQGNATGILVKKWQGHVDNIAGKLENMRGVAGITAEDARFLGEAQDSLKSYEEDFKKYVDARKSKEEALVKWEQVGLVMKAAMKKAMDSIINPAVEKARQAGKVQNLKEWSAIDSGMNEEVIQPFLSLQLMAISATRTDGQAEWTAFDKQVQKARQSVGAWLKLVMGKSELAATAGEVQQGLKDYLNAGNEYRSETQALKALNGAMMTSSGVVYEDIGKMQKRLNGNVKETLKSGERMIIGVVIIALMLGIGFALFIGRGVSKGIENMKAEAEKVAGDIVEGKLDSRCDVKKIDAEFHGVIKGVNNLIDAFVDPISVTAEYVDRISKGDMPEKIADEYRGDFNEIKNNLNMLIDAMNALINEAGAMEKAAAEGDLDYRADASKYTGAWATIVQGLNDTAEGMAVPMKDVGDVLEKLASGDCTVKVLNDYKGAYNELKEACNKLAADLNDSLGQVNIAVEQIAAGSQQVSDSAQALSQGATEQASSLEEITSSMNEIASQTKQNAENATQANQLSAEARTGAEKGNGQMKEMVAAMEEINESSQNISKIIKVIDEIAFQTNLLALNAAVEAARAGKHGKGFAVVAEEVRNLAARSAKAAKETAELIEGSVEKVGQGTQMASKTAEALDEIVAGVTKVTDLVGEIAAASNEQAQGVSQINIGLGQIDQVTQQNTATAEESASASEELSSQAAQLREMIARFKLARQNGKGQVPGMDQITPEMMEMAQKMMQQKAAPAPPATSGGNGKDAKGGNGKTQWGGVEQVAAQQNTVEGAEPVIALDDKEFGRF